MSQPASVVMVVVAVAFEKGLLKKFKKTRHERSLVFPIIPVTIPALGLSKRGCQPL